MGGGGGGGACTIEGKEGGWYDGREKDSLVTPDRVLNVLFFPQELMCVDLVDSVIVPVSYSKQSGKELKRAGRCQSLC